MTAKDFTLTKDDLQNKFVYKDGKLVHKFNKGKHKAGTEVGSARPDGYISTTINNKKWLIHRIVFMMHYGFLPKYIDHIDNNRQNNKIENLRPATIKQNAHNRKKHCTNKSGHKNIYWHKNTCKWLAQCDRKSLGYFENIHDAIDCVRFYRLKHHSEFTNHGYSCTN